MKMSIVGNASQTHVSRRDFLKSLSGAAASVLVFGSCENSKNSAPESPPPPSVRPPRSKAANVFVNSAGKPLLVCVTGNDFEAMLAAGLSELGGLGRLIGPNQDALIKPNCNAREPYPAISDLRSVLAIIKEVKKVTGGTVSVGDQGYVPSGAVYSFSGMNPAVEEAGAKLLTLTETYRVRRSTWPSTKPDFRVYAKVYDAPIIINTCCLKRHEWAVYTCAIKNNVGTVEGPHGMSTRYYLHYESSDLNADVVEVAGLVNPELNIVDARAVLTRGGPFYEDGVVVDAHKLVLCGDLAATDTYCANVLAAYDPTFSADWARRTVELAENLGLGTSDLSQVEITEISV